jgi:hypothetical protein
MSNIPNPPICSVHWRAEFARLEEAYAPATLRAYYADVQAFVT